MTTLHFRQSVDLDEVGVTSYDPGWEYYLDRLVALRSGDAFTDWDAYYPAQLPHWENEIRRASVSAG